MLLEVTRVGESSLSPGWVGKVGLMSEWGDELEKFPGLWAVGVSMDT